MKSLAVASVFASVALASSSSLIPSGISNNCESYLTSFNEDTSLSSCTSIITNATALFGAAANSGSTPATSDVTTALGALCSSSSSCPSTTVQTELTKFYAACSDELTTSSNKDVLLIYDVLYSFTPLQEAICAKDDNGNYCATESITNSSSSSSSLTSIAQTLWSTVSGTVSRALAVGRRDATSSLVVPNATTFTENNILFLMLQPTFPSASLCKTCTRNIITSYVNFESKIPYGPGIGSSELLSTQTALYQAVQSTCGASFLNGAVQAAGSLSGGLAGSSSGALRTIGVSVGAVGVAMGATVLGAMWVL